MASTNSEHILITVAGADTPGITAALTGVIADSQVPLLNIEQVVVEGQLTLCLLIARSPADSEPVLKQLAVTAHKMGLDLQWRVVDDDEPRLQHEQLYAVTAIGDELDARGVHILANLLAGHKANLAKIHQLSDGDLNSVELLVELQDGADAVAIRRELMAATADLGIDIAVQRETLSRRAKRLVVMDMDSTLIQMEVIDELARRHGVGEKVAAVTARAMAGELDYRESLAERVKCLEGMCYAKAQELASELPITDGAKHLLKVLRRLGFKTGVISGGFAFAANALKDQLGLDYAYANALDVEGGRLTGRVQEPVVDPLRKADLLDAIAQGEGIALEQTIAIGDGANDLAMLERAGLGIAFHGKAKLKNAADTSLSGGSLDRILYLLGLHARDIRDILR